MFPRSPSPILAALSCATALALSVFGAEDSKQITLQAEILPGNLEIVNESVAGPILPISGPAFSSSENQGDAIRFEIEGITINDLNGDDRGWTLTATPSELQLKDDPEVRALPIGSIATFASPSDTTNTSLNAPNQIEFQSGQGVVGYKVNYAISYDVPAFAETGTYQGVVQFTITAN